MKNKVCLVLAMAFVLNSVKQGDSSASRCYLCTSNSCGDPFDSFSATISACNKEFQTARYVDVDESVYAEAIANSNVRSKRSRLVTSSDSLSSTTTKTTTTTTTTEGNEVELIGENTEVESFSRFVDIKRKIWEFFYKIGLDDNASYVCVKTNYIDNGLNKTYRGCVPENHKNVRPCEVMSTALGFKSNTYITGCYTCTGNLCNSGTSVTHSLLFLGFAMFLKFLW